MSFIMLGLLAYGGYRVYQAGRRRGRLDNLWKGRR